VAAFKVDFKLNPPEEAVQVSMTLGPEEGEECAHGVVAWVVWELTDGGHFLDTGCRGGVAENLPTPHRQSLYLLENPGRAVKATLTFHKGFSISVSGEA